MNYFYEATDSSGQTVLGRLDAGSEIEVRKRLLQMGYQPKAVALNSGSPSVQPMPQQSPPAVQPMPQQMPPAAHITQHVAANTAPPVSQHGAVQNSVGSTSAARGSGIILSGSARTLSGSVQSVTAPRSPAAASPAASGLGGVNDRERLFFFQQLAALVKSGMSIYAALDNLGPRTPNRSLSEVTRQMADAARNGGRVSDVMEQHPRVFEEHIVGLVRAGELGGFLEIALSEIALNYEQNLALFKGAWLPKMMVSQALYALALAIPLFPDVLYNASLDKGIGPGLRMYVIHEAILLPATFLLIQAVKLGWGHLQLPQWRRFRDAAALRIPPYGDLQRQSALAAFVRMLRRLYHAGVGPAAAWEGAMQTASNVVIRDRLAASYALMQRGVSLADAFASVGLFDGNIEQLLMTGQLSGQVVESLDQIAEYYQERVQAAADKSRGAIFRTGRIVMLIIGGMAMAWLLHSCYAGVFHFVDTNFDQ